MSDNKPALVHEIIELYDQLSQLRSQQEELRKTADKTADRLSSLYSRLPNGSFYQVGNRLVIIRSGAQYPEVQYLEQLS